jgi:hypothetical protein
MHTITVSVSEEETIERYSSVTKGILIASFFIVFAFGVGAGLGLSVMMGQQPSEIAIPETYDVLGAQSDCCVMDTEQGTIEYHCGNLPEVLPLCITQADLDSWYVCLKVVGGYEPVCGSIELYQKGAYVATVIIDWWNWDSGPCWEYWRADFSLPDGVDMIKLDSNQWPAGATPCVDNPTIPGKEVRLITNTLWKGCDQREQMFTLIQTHKSDVFRVPNSE